ncbi:MAG: VWA domain-containing protein, partial [Candidatus Saccharicenans sp.]|nr:VWA domain-containing protein [Candidatus Saccharicenans sp.]
MKKRETFVFLWSIFILASLWLMSPVSLEAGPQAKSQEQQLPKELQIRPKHEVTVAVKLVQVYVTDREGKPAADLTAEDFEIYDNNKPVPLMHFEKHFPEELAPVPEKPRPAVTRKFILFFDLAFTDARGLMKARNAALKFMEKSILPTDEISLITYTAMRGLTIHEYMTRDHERIRKIIESFGLKSVAGRAENLANFFYSDTLMSFQGDQVSTLPEDSFFVDQARLQTGRMLDSVRRQGYVDQARFYLAALNNLAKSLKTVPGYKNIILFSAGLAKQLLFGRTGGATVGGWTTPEEYAAQTAVYDAAQADAGLSSDFTRLLKELKNSNCKVFTVDISRVHKELDVEDSTGAAPGIREIEGSDSLKLIATETGGKFYASTVNLENAMEEIVNTTRNFYILGFKVDEKWDGKYHKVKVNVKKKGYKVYSQAGYFNPKPFKEYDNFEKLLHLIEVALTEEPWPYLPIDMPVSGLTVVERGWPTVLAYARASGDVLKEVLGPRTEAYSLIFNERGDLISIKKFRVAVSEKDKKENDSFLPSFLLPLKPGKYECALVMRNMDNGKAARGRVPVEIPENLPVIPYADPPLILRLDDRANEVFASGEMTMASVYGYNPGTYSPAAGELPPEARRVYAALRIACPAGWEDGIEVRALMGTSGDEISQSVPVALLDKKREGEDIVFVLLRGVGSVVFQPVREK